MWTNSTHKLITICAALCVIALFVLFGVMVVRISDEHQRVRVEKIHACHALPDPLPCLKKI